MLWWQRDEVVVRGDRVYLYCRTATGCVVFLAEVVGERHVVKDRRDGRVLLDVTLDEARIVESMSPRHR